MLEGVGGVGECSKGPGGLGGGFPTALGRIDVQAGSAKTLKIGQYRCAPLSFSSSDLKF